MDIVRFTAGASAEALAGSTGGDRVVELGAASVAELLAEPAVALPAAKGRHNWRICLLRDSNCARRTRATIGSVPARFAGRAV